MLKSERQLVRLYNKFNLLYFNNDLTSSVAIFYAPVSAFADCDQLEDGTMRIRINPGISGWSSFVHMALLHECIHIKLWPYRKHGVKFDKEVQRLMGFKEIRKLF